MVPWDTYSYRQHGYKLNKYSVICSNISLKYQHYAGEHRAIGLTTKSLFSFKKILMLAGRT